MIAQNARQIQLRKRRVKLRLAERSKQAEREWAFLCKRFNANIRFCYLGDTSFKSCRSMLSLLPPFTWITVNYCLSPEEIRAEIARQFQWLEEHYSSPGKARETNAKLRQRMEDLSAWAKGGPRPEWIKRKEAL